MLDILRQYINMSPGVYFDAFVPSLVSFFPNFGRASLMVMRHTCGEVMPQLPLHISFWGFNRLLTLSGDKFCRMTHEVMQRVEQLIKTKACNLHIKKENPRKAVALRKGNKNQNVQFVTWTWSCICLVKGHSDDISLF